MNISVFFYELRDGIEKNTRFHKEIKNVNNLEINEKNIKK